MNKINNYFPITIVWLALTSTAPFIFFSWPGHRPERPYRRYGLQVYDRVSSSLFDYASELEVENICVYKRLD